MTGYPTFAEEFFDGVRVPAANLVGAEGDGWKVERRCWTSNGPISPGRRRPSATSTN